MFKLIYGDQQTVILMGYVICIFSGKVLPGVAALSPAS